MKKIVSLFLICMMISTCMLEYAPRVSADGTTDVTNVSLKAVATTTAGTSQNTISSINDDNMKLAWASANNPSFPAYVELDWGSKLVKTGQISISANYGPSQGIKTMDIEYFDGESWKAAKTGVTLNWKKNEQAAETLDIAIPEITASKIRLKVTSAAVVWGSYTIMELQVWGVFEPTAASVAESITHIEQPGRGQAVLNLPDVPEGYEIRIVSSDREDIIGLDGTITSTEEDAIVTLVLEVVKNKDQTKANTAAIQVKVLAKPSDTYSTLVPVEDRTNIIKNPAMGWVMYVEEFSGGSDTMSKMTAEEYWATVDPYMESASILYIRVPWSRLEPTEGHYAWNEDENYKKLVQGALDRNLKLAFRVVIDSQDVHMQATPQFVFDAGATGAGAASNSNFKTPRLTDPVFRGKFENFIHAFAEQYDDPSIVDFIDAGGMGYWGEMYTIVPSLTKQELDDTFKWIVNLYADNFKHVLLGQQDKSIFDLSLQDWAYKEKGFILRRDSYGSSVYLPPADKDSIIARWPDVPVFAENCYQNFVSRASSCDGQNKPIHDMLIRVVNDALDTHANTLDLRHPEDVVEFATNHADLVDKFALQGGYRFVLNDVSYPTRMASSKTYKVYHSWKNTGVGKLPNDLPNWGYKYKVAFALLDPDTQQPVKMIIDNAEPSDWLKGELYSYTGSLQWEGVPNGTYDLAVAIVDSTEDYKPAIKLAVQDMMTDTEWYKINEVEIYSIDKTTLNQAILDARGIYDEAIEGTEPGMYPVGSKVKLQEAIFAASVVEGSNSADQEEIELAITMLNAAINKFRNSVNPAAPTWNGTTTLSASSLKVGPGQSFEVIYGLRNISDVYAQSITIEYDAGAFEYVASQSLRDDVMIIGDPVHTAGKVSFILANAGVSIGGEVELLKLSFKALNASQSMSGVIEAAEAVLSDGHGIETAAAPSTISVGIVVNGPGSGIPGDFNGDGKVSIGDLAIIAANYGKSFNSPDWIQIKHLDINNDKLIDIEDLAAIALLILNNR